MQTTETTTPDPDEIENALARIQVVADILDILADHLERIEERYGRILEIASHDLTDARKAIYPVVEHLIREESRRDAA